MPALRGRVDTPGLYRLLGPGFDPARSSVRAGSWSLPLHRLWGDGRRARLTTVVLGSRPMSPPAIEFSSPPEPVLSLDTP